jgi:chemotaxis protein CheZ
MMKTKDLGSLVERLNQKRQEPVSFTEILALAELSAQSLQAFFETMDTTVYREMREIAGYIERMKGEIGALQADEIKKSRLPAAGQELGAIVQATESATNTIMECAEALMAADPSDIAAYQALVQEKVILIFEACSFQDITGQRIAKVCETLQLIETRVGRFASAVCSPQLAGFADDAERARQERKKRLMLNGPQLTGEGIDQSAVDDLFASATVAERKAAASVV